jgi:2-(1,2-epoxy-1,2-dihydrophenyl)acetyl-CoA isomerase
MTTRAAVRLLRRDGVLEIVLADPARLNRLDLRMAAALWRAVEIAASAPDLNAVLIRAEGRVFMAGGDIEALGAAPNAAPQVARRLLETANAAVARLAMLPMPVVVAVQGAAAGGGMALALACDVVLMSDEATYLPAYAALGVSPDCGLTHALTRRLGAARGCAIVLENRTVKATEALLLGLADRVVRAEELLSTAREVALRIGRGNAPDAILATRQLFAAATQHNLTEQLAAERESFVSLAATENFREGLTAFREKRLQMFRRGSLKAPVGAAAGNWTNARKKGVRA